MSRRRVYPFHCGSQFADWLGRNCDGCVKYDPEEATGECEIDEALGVAFLGDGSVSVEIGRRMGAIGNELALTWDCPEKEPR